MYHRFIEGIRHKMGSAVHTAMSPEAELQRQKEQKCFVRVNNGPRRRCFEGVGSNWSLTWQTREWDVHQLSLEEILDDLQ